MVESYVVAWADVLAYFQECRERALQELGDAEDTRTIGKAQGKIELCNELLNLKAVFQTIAKAQEEAAPQSPSVREQAKEAYRAQLGGDRAKP